MNKIKPGTIVKCGDSKYVLHDWCGTGTYHAYLIESGTEYMGKQFHLRPEEINIYGQNIEDGQTIEI